MRRRLTLVALAAPLLWLPVGAAQAATKTVSIKNIKYNPASITINQGDTVKWTQDDNIGHSVTADPGQPITFDSSPGCDSTPQNDNCLKPGDSFSVTFDASGTFTYHCRVHGSAMVGTIVVNAAATTTTEAPTTTAQPTTTTAKASSSSSSSSASTTTTSSTTSSTSTTSTTSTTTAPSSGSGQVAIVDNGSGKGSGTSSAPLLVGAALIVAGLAGLAYWMWWRSGDGYEEAHDFRDEPPPTVQGPSI